MKFQIKSQDTARVEEAKSALHAERLKKLSAWTENFGSPYDVTQFERTNTLDVLQREYATLLNGAFAEEHVKVAGRIKAIRNSGMFIVIEDASGTIQLFHDVKALNDTQKTKLALLDFGDIIGAEGKLRRTPRGELTVDAEQIDLLTKCIEPPAEKFHGLTDLESRVRERHKDLASNAESKKRLLTRFQMLRAIRRRFEASGFLEVETPVMQPVPGGAAARPFATHHKALDIPLYLRIAPELYLKRLIAGGLADRVFEVSRNFRNEGISPKHNPEFTSVEAYQAYANFEDMIELTEDIVSSAVQEIHDGKTAVQFQGKELDFKRPWARASMTSLIEKETGIDFMKLDLVSAQEQAIKLGLKLDENASWGKIVEEAFNEFVEHTLIAPTHVTHIPAEISPLAKPYADDPRLAERFESYANGWEIANAFSELNDPFLQCAHFMAQARLRDGGDEEAAMTDNDFVSVLEFGLPPTGGLGIGMDRLAMLLTDAAHIREVIAFPTMRPETSPAPSVSELILQKKEQPAQMQRPKIVSLKHQ